MARLMRLPFRRRSSQLANVGLYGRIGLRVMLEPDDVLSSLPPQFRDTVNEAYTKAEKALGLAAAAEQRVGWMEAKLEEEGTETSRLAALEAELERVKREIGTRTGMEM